MATPFIGEIKVVGFNFAPRGFAACDGQLLSISQNTALFSILGTNFGGDGQTTFALPDFRARAPMNTGNGLGLTPRVIGEPSGSASVTLLNSELPGHTHTLNSGIANPLNAAQETPTPSAQAMFSLSGPGSAYADNPTPAVPMAVNAIGPSGNTLPHDNLQPILALNFVIALNGIFPARN